MKVVINRCYGGFGLSEAAYEKLIEWGVPVRAYVDQKRDNKGRYLPEPQNDGEVIFDRRLGGRSFSGDVESDIRFMGRYWDCWTEETRNHPMVVRVVEELGSAANGRCAELTVVEIPDDVNWEISEYDGMERVAEKHRSWS